MERQHLSMIRSTQLKWKGLATACKNCVNSTPGAWIVKQEVLPLDYLASRVAIVSWTILIQKTQASIHLPVPAPLHSHLLFPLQEDAVNYITELIRIKSDWPDCVLTQTFVLKHEGEGARLRTQWSGRVYVGWDPAINTCLCQLEVCVHLQPEGNCKCSR